MKMLFDAHSVSSVAFLLCISSVAFAQSPTRVNLYNFPGTGPNMVGNANETGLVADSDGNLYGTTNAGYNMPAQCNYGCGTVYKMTPPHGHVLKWQRTTLYQFKGKNDGAFPNGGVAFGADGALYGTANLVGSTGTHTGATIFRLTPPATGAKTWAFSTIISMPSSTFGSNLYIDGSNTIYGIDDAYGDVFSVQLVGNSWVLSPIASPGYPVGGVIADGRGGFYGVTSNGGSAGYGTVFQLVPPTKAATQWVVKEIYAFTGQSDGEYPSAEPSLGTSGKTLYGVTVGGNCSSQGECGTVFRLTHNGKTWKEKTLYAFDGTGSSTPLGSLLVNGDETAVYGTTLSGAANCGSVFKLTPAKTATKPWEALMYGFQQADGSCNPVGNLLPDGSGVGVIGTAETVFGSVFDVRFP